MERIPHKPSVKKLTPSKRIPVGLDQEKAEQIIDALNTDLADAYVLYHQLHTHHWNVEDADTSKSTASFKKRMKTWRRLPTMSLNVSKHSAASPCQHDCPC